jgi:hypothetical protein
MSAETTVWISPSATSYACLCEPCLEAARVRGDLFGDALGTATVRGTLELDAVVTPIRCAAGHELLLRRVERPPSLTSRDERQLSIA